MNINRKKIANYLFIVSILAFFIVSFTLPSNHATMVRYHLSSLSLRFLDLTILIPEAIIWSISYYGYSKLNNYAKLINGDKDGKEFIKIAYGLGILAFGQPIKGTVTAILALIAQDHHRFIPSYTIINNYLSVVLTFAAFILISEGAYGLTVVAKKRPTHRATQLLAAFLVLIGACYCYLVFNNSVTKLHLGVTNSPIYYLPNVLILLTIVVPYIFIWFMGLFAAYEIYLFKQKISGKLYKKSMQLISLGLSEIIVILILLQYLTTLSSHLLDLKIVSILFIIYPLLILMSLGYILVALGAKQLRKIEEV